MLEVLSDIYSAVLQANNTVWTGQAQCSIWLYKPWHYTKLALCHVRYVWHSALLCVA